VNVQVVLHEKRVLGIDEAGRGPIVGPMVLAAVALRPTAAAALTRAGVADSKRFAGPDAQEARAALVPVIHAHADHVALRVICVDAIDAACAEQGLNRLEQRVAAELIDEAPPVKRIVCDGARLFAPLTARYAHLESYDEGESRHVAVAAASILAKVRRDELWGAIWARYARLCDLPPEPQGGGYVNERTRAFLRTVVARLGHRPPEGRTAWPWTFLSSAKPEQAQQDTEVPVEP
jgi:ribonuclease HII